MTVVEYLARTPPRCLTGLRPVLISAAAAVTVWRLRCGSERGVVLGHPLGALKPGSERLEFMVSPLRYCCADCEASVEFLDTDVHGEGGEFKTREGGEYLTGIVIGFGSGLWVLVW